MIADRKGEDILLLDIREFSILADYFVIASVNSERQAKAIVNVVRQEAKQAFDVKSARVEGEPETGWVVVDMGYVVVHVFSSEMRAYYNLEDFWADARTVVRMI